MRRKVSKVGPATLVVSLPSKWAKQNNVKKGDEIDIKENENSLLLSISGTKEEEKKEISIDIDGLPDTLIFRYIIGAYKEGFYTIKVNFTQTKIKTKGRLMRKGIPYIELPSLFKDITASLVGMEIILTSNNYYILKQIADPSQDELLSTIRRIIYILKFITTETIRALKNKDAQLLSSIDANDLLVNKFSNYCIRLVHQSQDANKELDFLLINYLEDLGDHIKELPNLGSKDSEELIEILELIIKNLDMLNNTVLEKDNINQYYDNCIKLLDIGKKIAAIKAEVTGINRIFKEIGQCLIEKNLLCHQTGQKFSE